MRISTNLRRTGEAAKSLEIDNNGLKMKANEENCSTPDANGVISLLSPFNVYI